MNQNPDEFPEDAEWDEQVRWCVFQDPASPDIEYIGRKTLRAALEHQAAQEGSLDKLWETFRDFVRDHEYGEAVARAFATTKNELVLAYQEKHAEALSIDAEQSIREQIKKDIWGKLYIQISAEIEPQVRSQVESDLRIKISNEVERNIRGELLGRMRDKIESEVRAEIKQHLMQDPAIRAQAIPELERTIIGL